MSAKGRLHEGLEARLGYRFADPDLLHQALTHASALSPGKRVSKSYQRLEFLGDRVLGLVVADMLYRRLPKASEGDLNRSFVTLVRGETCAAIARQLEFGPDLNLGDAEKRTGGAGKDAILGDAAEAVIGAIYLDGGLSRAYEFLERMLGDYIGYAVNRRPDAKTTLQEWAQSKGLEPPNYVVIEQTGPVHAPVFTIEARLASFAPVAGSGASKRVAEQDAAERFLVRENVWKDTM